MPYNAISHQKVSDFGTKIKKYGNRIIPSKIVLCEAQKRLLDYIDHRINKY